MEVSDEFKWLADRVANMTEIQAQSPVDEARARVALGLGDHRATLDLARRSYQTNNVPDRSALQTPTRAAAWIGDRPALTDALTVLRALPGRVLPPPGATSRQRWRHSTGAAQRQGWRHSTGAAPRRSPASSFQKLLADAMNASVSTPRMRKEASPVEEVRASSTRAE